MTLLVTRKLFNSLALSNLLSSYSHSRYYMTESAKGQDEANPTFLLATRAGEMDPPSPLEISRVGPKRTKLIWSKSTSVCESKVLAHRPHCCLQQFITRAKRIIKQLEVLLPIQN